VLEEARVLKLFRIYAFREYQERQLEFYNEFMITRIARKRNSKRLLHLQGYIRGPDYLGFSFKRFELSFEDYLKLSVVDVKRVVVFREIVKGVMELHSMGYVHRDLKPQNVVLNLQPLEVRLIDFGNSMPVEDMMRGTIKGTNGYYPTGATWVAGDLRWDVWSLGAMVLELRVGESFKNVNTSR